jgi:hypothetical protein
MKTNDITISYIRTTKEIPNPNHDGRKRRDVGATIPKGMLLQVRTEHVENHGLRYPIISLEHFGCEWNIKKLPPLDEWSEVVEPTTLEWLQFEKMRPYLDHHLTRLIEKGIVTRAMLEEINQEPDAED